MNLILPIDFMTINTKISSYLRYTFCNIFQKNLLDTTTLKREPLADSFLSMELFYKYYPMDLLVLQFFSW
jgi:hypothetical protein